MGLLSPQTWGFYHDRLMVSRSRDSFVGIVRMGTVCNGKCLVRRRKETLCLMEAKGQISNENFY